MNYLIGTGAYKVGWDWGHIWYSRVQPYIQGDSILCFSDRESRFILHDHDAPWVRLDQNLGHVGDLLSGAKKNDFCGWSATVLGLAMTAYASGQDLIYVEQDCLAFGPWVEQMYSDMGSGDMVFGRAMKSSPWMPCAQSLFLIRHSFLPHFVAQYLYMGPDGSLDNLPETKFVKLEAQNSPGRIRRLSFGYDRERPINFDDKVWYAQKFSREELDELRRRKMI